MPTDPLNDADHTVAGGRSLPPVPPAAAHGLTALQLADVVEYLLRQAAVLRAGAGPGEPYGRGQALGLRSAAAYLAGRGRYRLADALAPGGLQPLDVVDQLVVDQLVDEDAGVDLRACCDHPPHEPNRCPVYGRPHGQPEAYARTCDCDGDGPTVAVDAL